jgi:hypothetical protein
MSCGGEPKRTYARIESMKEIIKCLMEEMKCHRNPRGERRPSKKLCKGCNYFSCVKVVTPHRGVHIEARGVI